MIKLNKAAACSLHELIAKQTGGGTGLRDEGLLDSALQSAYATFDGNDLYPTVEEKAVKTGFGLISNHAFVDGNKRVGMLAMLALLEVNGITLELTDDDVIYAGLGVASGSLDYAALLDFVMTHKR